MDETLTIDDIKHLLATTPEQRLFDWKRDFALSTDPKDERKKGELVKDIVAIANGTAFAGQTGYLIYGVDPRNPSDPIVGITERWDDAKVQQLVAGVVKPGIDFLYYEVDTDDGRTVAVIQVTESQKPFHVIARDLGSLREGQILIRAGSSTRGIRWDELQRLYLTPGLGYAEKLLHEFGLAVRAQEAQNALIARLDADILRAKREMEAFGGLPPGSVFPS
jgi:hypothetical protein